MLLNFYVFIYFFKSITGESIICCSIVAWCGIFMMLQKQLRGHSELIRGEQWLMADVRTVSSFNSISIGSFKA